MRTLNLGILAHVDAGKTSLTERLLYSVGVLDRLGRVDDGSTQTDTMALERQRGITIRSSVASFEVADLRINLVDTPGHPDFIAEVERALGVLDAVVLVVSAVEGVQPQTRILMRALQRLCMPTLLFVNKIDRVGARGEDLVAEIAHRLSTAVVPMTAATDAGSPLAAVHGADTATAGWRMAAMERLAEHDDTIFAAYVHGWPLPTHQVLESLRCQAGRGLVHPLYLGSAMTGAGIGLLLDGVRTMLIPAGGDPGAPISGRVFSIAPDGSAWVRMYDGTLRMRDHVTDAQGRQSRVTALTDAGGIPVPSLSADDIGMITGLDHARVGDAVGLPGHTDRMPSFRPASLEAVIDPVTASDRGRLLTALTTLRDADPLINLRQDDDRQEISLSLYGEVQKEVIAARLADEFDVRATFRPTGIVCVERVTGTGTSLETIAVPPNPYLATVGLRIEPAPVDSGIRFQFEIELGSMPPAFFSAVRAAVGDTLDQGLAGWQVTDCVVTMTHSGYWARQSRAHGSFDKKMSSTAGDFRDLTRAMVMRALRRAGTHVCEPVHAFRLDVLIDQVAVVLPALARWEADLTETVVGDHEATLRGYLPARLVDTAQQRLPTMTSGEGVWESTLDHHQPVRGTYPRRPRVGVDPGDWDRYVEAHPR